MGKYTAGTYADINRFVIDRTYDNITEFVDKVAHQLLAVNDFADAPKTNSCRQWTELRYELSSMEEASEKAAAAITSSIDMIPYVMPFPNRCYLCRIAICLYLGLVITGDNVAVIAWKAA